jgi:hypothetical protein
MVWKDQLLPGASRIALPYDGNLAPGFVLDAHGSLQERNDWVMGPHSTPVISGSSEAQPGAANNGGAGSALYAALATAQGQAAAAKARADAGRAHLEALISPQGPTIGGYNIESAQAIPFLQALGLQGGGETELERQQRLAREAQLGVT